jgi:hypothetical protein
VAGEVSAVLSSDLDYIGVFEQVLELPSSAGVWQLGVRTAIPVISISGASAFIVEDLDYRVRICLKRGAALAWAPFIELRGSEAVDKEGSRTIGLAGMRVGQTGSERDLEWEAEAAAVAGDAGLEARAAAALSAEWRALRRPSWEAGLRALWDGLWLRGADPTRADLAAGGFLRLRRPAALGFSLHALYFRGRHPLGLEETGVLAGIRIEDLHPRAGFDSGASFEGALAAGGGNDRVRARQLLLLSTGVFSAARPGVRFRMLADNVLLDAESPDLYYVLEGGFEAAEGAWRPGVHIHHRSGHLLGADNRRRLSLNLLELGVRSPEWAGGLPRWRASGAAGTLDYEVRAGRVLTSEFGDHQHWSARGGATWTPPGRFRRLAPFLSLCGQAGEARGWSAGAGAHGPGGAFLVLAAERDSQRIDRRDTSWTLSAGRAFRP